MSQTINVLFLAAEAEPFIKVGGLGDVAGSLPRALRALSNDDIKLDVRLVLPYHPAVKADNLKPLGMFSIARGGAEIQVEAFETSLNGMPVYFIGGEPIRANGSVYSLNAVLDAEKYTFFSLAALELSRHTRSDWFPDVIHGNDWHTALSMYGSLTKRWEDGARHVASVITLHNLPFMGPDVTAIMESYGVKLAQTDLPDWARVMPLPLGLWASDAIVAVSPTYGREILTQEYGCGLDDFLRSRGETVSGILNGLDTASFNPADDPALGVNFDINSLEKRAANKKLLQERLGLPREPETPLLAMVSRMDKQKGVDLVFAALKMMKRSKWQAVILGTGDPKLEEAALALQELFPERVKVETRYDGGLARQIYAGSDIFLMPSRYEPCGLSQMIAMRYGCVPIARAAGGLNDTVKHRVTGFVFEKPHHMALAASIKSAFKVFAEREKWQAIQRAGMAQDFSWENSAKKYLELYKSIIKS
ncbi:MAG: glycogen synthase [Anaerolineales bacterium]|nr:glycogen synthase [Anaerolineales bacterium]